MDTSTHVYVDGMTEVYLPKSMRAVALREKNAYSGRLYIYLTDATQALRLIECLQTLHQELLQEEQEESKHGET